MIDNIDEQPSNDIASLNVLWSKLMIKELIHHGVRMFCIAPGSQSTPLIIAATHHPLAKTHFHYDERGMGFYALGYAKASRCPAALIVTSGTAVANLLPAIMEAYYDHIPLIVITADRPPELRDCGANQTCDQVKIFENFMLWQTDLPCPDANISTRYIGSIISRAVASSSLFPSGPVHINCMLRKPLFTYEDPTPKMHSITRSQHSAQTMFVSGQHIMQSHDMEQLANELSEYEKGVILVSTLPSSNVLEPLYTLARLLQWPIFPDILSYARSAGIGYGVVPYYDLILKTFGINEDFSIDAILQIGDRFVSQQLYTWIASKKPKMHCHVSAHVEIKDPVHSVTHRFACDTTHFVQCFSRYLPGRAPSSWFRVWKELNDITSHALRHFFTQHNELSEPLLFHHLAAHLNDAKGLFISNSMPIRNADAFFCPQTSLDLVFCNRGLSGIDGNIASAAGIARALEKPIVAILGDIAFIHDMNSLAQLQDLSIKLLVINNNGCSIFSFLPIAQRKELFTPFFTASHGLNFKHAALLFGLEYTQPKTLEELQEILLSSSSCLVEIQIPFTKNIEIHKNIIQYLQERHNRPKLMV